MTDLPLAIGVGATVITKEKYDRLPSQSQQILWETAQKYHQELVQQVRKDNDRAIEALKKKAGIQIVTVDETEQKQWNEFATKVQNELAGRVYPKELLEQVNALLSEYRTGR